MFMISEGVDLSVEILLGKYWKKRLFLTNPLFSQFSIWIAQNLETIFSIREMINILLEYVVKRLHKVTLSVTMIQREFPALFVGNKTITNFLLDVMSNCSNEMVSAGDTDTSLHIRPGPRSPQN